MAAESDPLLQWGNRKRLWCIKVHRRDVEAAATAAAEKAAASQRRAAAAVEHRILRDSEETGTMRSSSQQQQNNSIHMMASSDREHPVRGGNNTNNGNLPASLDNKGSSSGSEGSVWPKFAIALTNKEKNEDFLVFKSQDHPIGPRREPRLPPSPLIVHPP